MPHIYFLTQYIVVFWYFVPCIWSQSSCGLERYGYLLPIGRLFVEVFNLYFRMIVGGYWLEVPPPLNTLVYSSLDSSGH